MHAIECDIASRGLDPILNGMSSHIYFLHENSFDYVAFFYFTTYACFMGFFNSVFISSYKIQKKNSLFVTLFI